MVGERVWKRVGSRVGGLAMRRGMPTQVMALAVGAACLLGLPGSGRAQNFVEQNGALKVQGNRIVNAQGQPVTLRGMALYWSQWKPAFYNKQCIQWLRDDWKCNVVRASMAVTDGGYLTDANAEMNKVRTVVQAAIDLGIYVIVDFHETKNGNDHLDASKKFFGDLTKEFGKYPNLIYETWNEPDNTMNWATHIKPYHEAVIPVIRANSNGIILCGTRNWCQEVDEAAKNPITSSTNIAYTLHFYATDHRDFLRTKATTALNSGIALMVTEGGLSEASGGGRIDTAEATRWCDFMDKNGILWTNWSLADLTESSGALKVGASPTGGWNESQMNPSGVWVRNRLRMANQVVSLGDMRRAMRGGRGVQGGQGVQAGRGAYGAKPVTVLGWSPLGGGSLGAADLPTLSAGRNALGQRLVYKLR